MAITRITSPAITSVASTAISGTLPAANINNTSIGNVTALPSAIPIGVDGISSSATSTLLTLSSDNRLGIDQSSDINQIISASGLNGQIWMCGGVWGGSASVKLEFNLNSNTSFVLNIKAYGYGSGINYSYGNYRTGTQFATNFESDGGNSVTYTQPDSLNTFTTAGMTHGTYQIQLTGNLSGSPLITIV